MDNQHSASVSGGQPGASEQATDVFGRLIDEVRELRESNAQLKARVEQFTSQGEAGVDAKHVNHVMAKHFWNDRPDETPGGNPAG